MLGAGAARVLPAAELPVGTVVQAGPNRYTKTGRSGRCPWRLGARVSLRFVANWRVQELLNAGASIVGGNVPPAGPSGGEPVAAAR